jgi:hypothetical protein
VETRRQHPTETNMATVTLAVGMKVEIVLADDAPLYTTAWWPKRGVRVTGTVTKLFKNGMANVAIDQLRNRSEDGLHTMRMDAADLVPSGTLACGAGTVTRE